LFLFHSAIQHYEKKHSLVRGTPQSIQSAVGFGDYYRYVLGFCWGGIVEDVL
jgi:hypothetical protein